MRSRYLERAKGWPQSMLLKNLNKTAHMLALAAIALLSAVHAQQPTHICDPMSYGARADGVTKDTKAMQKAIDVCAKSGGGTVRIAQGTMLIAPIVLKSHITLEVVKGAKLLGSPDPKDYPQSSIVNGNTPQPLIYSDHAEDITITGGGIIDGNGEPFWKKAKETPGKIAGAHTRPRLIVFDHTNHVRMHDITVQNGAQWQITPYFDNDVDIHNIRVIAPADSPNTDGIDPFSSHHVRIAHVFIDVGDDNVAVKSGMPGSKGDEEPCTDITVTDAVFGHGHGMSIGSEGTGGMQQVYAERIHFKNTTNGIRIKSARDRGNHNMGDFHFTDITMEDVKYPILIDHYYHAPSEVHFPRDDARPQPITRKTPIYHNISITNLKATGAKIAAIVAMLPESPLHSITLKNVSIDAEQGMLVMNATVKAINLTLRVEKGKPFTELVNGRVLVARQ